jgi:hypothetical protein
MMRIVYLITGMTFLLALSACKGGSKVSSSVSKKIDDDLSKYMYKPKVVNANTTTEPKETVATQSIVFEKHINRYIDPLMDSIAIANKRYQSAPGYRIMVYSGNSSEASAEARREVYDWSRDYDVYTQYKQPAFRVKVGNFADRINANYVFSDLVKFFPNAVIIPDQIEIK